MLFTSHYRSAPALSDLRPIQRALRPCIDGRTDPSWTQKARVCSNDENGFSISVSLFDSTTRTCVETRARSPPLRQRRGEKKRRRFAPRPVPSARTASPLASDALKKRRHHCCVIHTAIAADAHKPFQTARCCQSCPSKQTFHASCGSGITIFKDPRKSA